MVVVSTIGSFLSVRYPFSQRKAADNFYSRPRRNSDVVLPPGASDTYGPCPVGTIERRGRYGLFVPARVLALKRYMRAGRRIERGTVSCC